MGKQLTPEMIIQRTKSDKFAAIKNLNLWGNDLDDISVIKELPNLEVLSLSVNRITTLRDFATCPKLTELYLRKNAIADISEVQYLAPLHHLRVLWLWDNPCAETPNYRLVVIHFLPQLVKLDNTEITGEERDAAKHIKVEEALAAAPVAQQPAPTPVEEHVAKKRSDPPAPAVEAPAPAAVSEVDDRPLNMGQPGMVRPPAHPARRQPQLAAVRAEPERERARPEPMRVEPEPTQDPSARNENILCAVLALLKELDGKSLELVKRDIDRKLAGKK